MGDTIQDIASPIADVFGPLLGGPRGSAQDARNMVGKVNPMLQKIQEQQVSQAANFNNNIGNFEQDQINAATDASRLRGYQQQKQANSGSNARGLLYGGYNENQKASAAAGNESSLNNQISNINSNAQGMGQQLNNEAINSGLLMHSYNRDYQNRAYNAAMNQQQQNAQGFNSMVSGIGGLLGA